ncbi:bet v i allergen [Colletotrichum karsti]|uniref:Bet v i allergen n=1 Tax=Colletotrichum karsti TaxID=1095194 RepID=A0A9P6I6G5_9PEZI|nr:bet v i allergen [Colletotrichum karsti]KAF9876755.1 bet v i allergen [Colletotrichum karsti]
MKLSSIAAFPLLLLSGVTSASPLTPRNETKIFVGQVKDTFNASVGTVWGIYSAFGAAQLYMKNVTFNELTGFGPGAVRAITLAGQFALERLDWVDAEKHSLAYTLYDAPGLPAVNIQGTIELNDIGDNKTGIVWTARADSITPGAEEGIRARVLDIYTSSIAIVQSLV